MIYVNGASGMIGRNLVKKLINPIEFNSNHLSYMDEIKLALKLQYADTIIHLDAYGANDDSIRHVDSIISLQKVIKCMPKHCQLIFISTCTLYKSSKDIVDEESELYPSTQYLKSKLFCENLIEDNVINYTILRLSNVISNDMKHGIIYDMSHSHAPNDSIMINSKYPGSIRSFISIKNVIEAIILSIGSEPANRQTINVCGNDSCSELEIAGRMQLKVSSYLDNFDSSSIKPSNNKMKDILGFYLSGNSRYVIEEYLRNKGYFGEIKLT